ncbi:hypothetical protein, partial [Klebsiella pneumoniae]
VNGTVGISVVDVVENPVSLLIRHPQRRVVGPPNSSGFGLSETAQARNGLTQLGDLLSDALRCGPTASGPRAH